VSQSFESLKDKVPIYIDCIEFYNEKLLVSQINDGIQSLFDFTTAKNYDGLKLSLLKLQEDDPTFHAYIILDNIGKLVQSEKQKKCIERLMIVADIVSLSFIHRCLLVSVSFSSTTPSLMSLLDLAPPA
jgi:hypothetical protein